MQAQEKSGRAFLSSDDSDEQTYVAVLYDRNGKFVSNNSPSRFRRLLRRATKRRRRHGYPGLSGSYPHRRVKAYRSPTQQFEDDIMDDRSSQVNDGDDEDDELGRNDETLWARIQMKVAKVEKTVQRTHKILNFYKSCEDAPAGRIPVWVPTPSEVADGIDPTKPDGMPYGIRGKSLKRELHYQRHYLHLLQQHCEPRARAIILRWYKASLIHLRTLGSQGAPLAMGSLQYQALRALLGPDHLPFIDGKPARIELPDGWSVGDRYPSQADLLASQEQKSLKKSRIIQWLKNGEESNPPLYDQLPPDNEPVYRPYATDMEMFYNLGYAEPVLNGQAYLLRVVPPSGRFPNVFKMDELNMLPKGKVPGHYPQSHNTQGVDSSDRCPSGKTSVHDEHEGMLTGN